MFLKTMHWNLIEMLRQNRNQSLKYQGIKHQEFQEIYHLLIKHISKNKKVKEMPVNQI